MNSVHDPGTLLSGSFVSIFIRSSTICCCSITRLCLTPCDRMDYSTPGFPVLHHLLEFAQTHVHWVDDAIQPSHPLLPISPLILNLSQHQGLVQWVSSSHQVGASASPWVLPMNIQGWFSLIWKGTKSDGKTDPKRWSNLPQWQAGIWLQCNAHYHVF